MLHANAIKESTQIYDYDSYNPNITQSRKWKTVNSKKRKQFLGSVNTTIYYFHLDDYMFQSLSHHQTKFTKLRIR